MLGDLEDDRDEDQYDDDDDSYGSSSDYGDEDS